MSVRGVSILALCLLWPSLAAASELQLVGSARLKVLFWPVYDSRLYTADGRYDSGKRPLRLEIEYLRDIPADQLLQRTAQEWRSIGVEHPRQEEWLRQLGDLWPDIKRDDILTLELDDAGAARFYHNGDPLGDIADADFGAQFVAIWLSPDTSRPELRARLIGEAD